MARMRPVPEIADRSGRTRVGVLATLVDVVAGERAIRSVLPNWTATSDLSVYVDEVPRTGAIEATAEILRTGRQTIVLEATLREADGEAPFGVGQIGFAVLAARGDIQTRGHWAEAPEIRTVFARPDSGFQNGLLETMGLEESPGDPSRIRLPHIGTYATNSLDALQGGAVAIVLDACAERFAAAELACDVRVRSVAIHYLKLGRVGPIRAEAQSVARTTGGLLVRVTLVDEGADDALLTVAMIQVDEAFGVA